LARKCGRHRLTRETSERPISTERAVQHPFGAIQAASALAIAPVTALSLAKHGGAAAEFFLESLGYEIGVRISAAGGEKTCRIWNEDAVPAFTVGVASAGVAEQ
jgi:hypothetical protein